MSPLAERQNHSRQRGEDLTPSGHLPERPPGAVRSARPSRPGQGSQTVAIIAAVGLAASAGALADIPWTWAVIGGVAAVAIVAAVPRIAVLATAVFAYAGAWTVFNLLRAPAEDVPWADQMLGVVVDLEARLAGGTLPSALLQERFYDAQPLAWYDYGWATIYFSFFFVPHLVAIVLLWRRRDLFWHYLLALVGLFVLALIGFYALPTAPPWLVTEVVSAADFEQIYRVPPAVARSLDLPVELYHRGLRGNTEVSEVKIEPNPMAAMPSIHFAATTLVALVAHAANRLLGALALVYTLLMGIALVYLGEHYVLDLVAGGLLAIIGWVVAGSVLDRWRKTPP